LVRDMVNEVLLPNWPKFHGRCLLLSPCSTMQSSQAQPSTSAATREVVA
jgi:hypothetical protein